MRRIVVLWGSSGVYGDDGSGQVTKYRQALNLIEEGAKLYDAEISLIQYPGHPNREGFCAGELNFPKALIRVVEECDKIKPEWIIGRSFGASVGVAALGCGGSWVNRCRGMVLWGPAFNHYLLALWPTKDDKLRMISDYKQFKTNIAPNFFETLPDLRDLVVDARASLRFARGTKDSYNSSDELNDLERLHAKAQPVFQREVFELEGLNHTPTSLGLTVAQRNEYLTCLFKESFDRRKNRIE